MTLDDLKSIFKEQIESGETTLCYILINPDKLTIKKCDADKLETLLPILDKFRHTETKNKIPRFSETNYWYGKLGSYKE